MATNSGFGRRLTSRRKAIHSFEAEENKKRSFGEKTADLITSHLGSMTFLVMNALWFAVWIYINAGHKAGIRQFDPYPFGLLTMIVSLEAIFLAIIVLISQNRSAITAKMREEIDLYINTLAEEEITKMMELLILLLKKNNIDTSNDAELKQMLEPTDTEKIERSIKKQLD